MKTHNSHISIAALSSLPAGSAVGIAVCALSAESQTNDGWCQLLPAGEFSAVDGRPEDVPGGQWLLTAELASNIIGQINARTNPLVVDYEHQTLNALQNGQPAPAAGRFKDIEWREGSGLWIKPVWTAKAADFIRNGEYAFLSAVFPYSKNGHVLGLHSAALTNAPGLDGMAAVEALRASLAQSSNDQESIAMDETLIAYLKQLGVIVPENPTEADIKKAITEGTAALTALQAKAGSADTLAAQVATLTTQVTNGTGTPDPAKYVPIEAVAALQAQVATFAAQQKDGEKDQLITAALSDGRLIPAMKAWAEDLGTKDIAALKTYLEKAPKIAALSQMQTEGLTDDQKKANEQGNGGGNNSVAALTVAEKEAARLSGMTEQEYADNKAKVSA